MTNHLPPELRVIVDLYCGGGGASMGYHRAGFIPVGVDHLPQPHYPFRMVQADALEFLRFARLDRVAAIHASPPCRARSTGTPVHARDRHPKLIGPTRAALIATGRPWVMENVPPHGDAEPLRPDLITCGCMFPSLDRLERVRWWETSWRAFDLRPPCSAHAQPTITVLRHGARYEVNRRRGDGHHRHVPAAEARAAMGIDWLPQRSLGDAIPPPFAQYVAGFIIEHLTED